MAIRETPSTLPSRGLPYGGKIPEGRITIKMLTASDLGVLFSQGNEADRIDRIIQSVAVLPNAFDPKDLLLTDRMSILLAMRILSFGQKYGFEYTCRHCGARQEHTCDLMQDLSEKPLAPDLGATFDVALPDCGNTLTVRFMTGRDERAVMQRTKQHTSARSVAEPGDPSNMFRQATLITAIDGVAAGDLIARETFIRKNMSARDSIILDNEIDAREPGVDTTVHPECQRCGGANELALPFTMEFFRPSSLRA
jgi:hypothetical protein